MEWSWLQKMARQIWPLCGLFRPGFSLDQLGAKNARREAATVLSCLEGGVVCCRDLDRFAGLGIPGPMCCNVPDVEGAEARETYRRTAGKVV